jgi:hypothetical protein
MKRALGILTNLWMALKSGGDVEAFFKRGRESRLVGFGKEKEGKKKKRADVNVESAEDGELEVEVEEMWAAYQDLEKEEFAWNNIRVMTM